jgi:hypothetical protein
MDAPQRGPVSRWWASRTVQEATPFGFLRSGQAQMRGLRKLFRRAGLVAGPRQRLAPFQMQAAPVGRVFVRFFKLSECEIGTVLRDERLAPHLQRVGEMRVFPVRGFELRDGAVEIASRHQHRAPV